MIVKGELILVDEKDKVMYNTLPTLLKDQYDKGKISMETIKRSSSSYQKFVPNFNISEYSLFYQGLYKENPADVIVGIKSFDKNIKREI